MRDNIKVSVCNFGKSVVEVLQLQPRWIWGRQTMIGICIETGRFKHTSFAVARRLYDGILGLRFDRNRIRKGRTKMHTAMGRIVSTASSKRRVKSKPPWQSPACGPNVLSIAAHKRRSEVPAIAIAPISGSIKLSACCQ